MFTLLVCSDLWGTKENLEIVFPSTPSMAELVTHIESIFSYEGMRLRPPNVPETECAFRVTRLQIYDDAVMRWVELTTPSQLHDFDQLYAFQRTSPWHIDVQKDLPPPRPPALQRSLAAPQAPAGHGPSPFNSGPPPHGAVSQPQRSMQISPGPNYNTPSGGAAPPSYQGGATAPRGVTTGNAVTNLTSPVRVYGGSMPRAADPDKVRHVFDFMDKSKNSYLSLNNFTEAFSALGIRFSSETCKDMFSCYCKGKAYLSFADFGEWGEQYPNVLDAAHHRIGDRLKEQQLREQHRLCQQQGQLQRQRYEDLSRELDAVKQESLLLERRAKENEDRLRDMGQQRTTIEQQEQVLLDKELRLAFQREELRRHEMDFRETARGFDRVAESWGSPRRSRPI